MQGITEIIYDKETGSLIGKQVDYVLVERNGRRCAEPIGKPRSASCFNTWWPLENVACKKCGVDTLVPCLHMGAYACAHCGETCILAPTTSFDIRTA